MNFSVYLCVNHLTYDLTTCLHFPFPLCRCFHFLFHSLFFLLSLCLFLTFSSLLYQFLFPSRNYLSVSACASLSLFVSPLLYLSLSPTLLFLSPFFLLSLLLLSISVSFSLSPFLSLCCYRFLK